MSRPEPAPAAIPAGQTFGVLHRRRPVRTLTTLSIVFVLLAIPLLVDPQKGSRLGGAIILAWSAWCAAAAWRTRRLGVIISTDEVVLVNVRSTKTYPREQASASLPASTGAYHAL